MPRPSAHQPGGGTAPGMTPGIHSAARLAASHLAAGGALGAASRLLADALGETPGAGDLDLLSAVAAFAGVALGWTGGLGFALANLVLGSLEWGNPRLWALFGADLACSWTAFGAFVLLARHQPVARGLPNTRSYLALVGATLAAAATSAPLVVVGIFGRASWASVGTWWAGAAAANVLVVPLLLIAVPLTWWRLAAPVPREAPQPSRSRSRLQTLAAGATVIFFAAVLFQLDLTPSPAHGWLALLYVLPVVWSCWQGGLRAGVAVGSLAGLGFLLQAPPQSPDQLHAELLARQSGAVIFPLLGGLLGGAREREKRLRAELRSHLASLVQALRSALGAKDAYTEGHVSRVCQQALATGANLGMSRDQLQVLEVASLLHDVGKIGVPESILHKPEALDRAETELMQRHPEIGARMVEELEGLSEAAPLIRHHQERYDGRRSGEYPGYPAGLRGDEIPLGSRVIAVVDAYDAMTSTRSYREALSEEEARRVLSAERGRQFDPDVVNAFLDLLERGPRDEPPQG